MLIKFFFIRVFNFVVAKRTSVFDDPTMEIQELTSVIKQDITALNSAVVDLQLISNSRNESGNVSTDTTSHSTTVVDDLKTRLMSTTKEFKDVLTMRTEVLFFVICICVIVHFFLL
jgi:syntaxin 5